MVGSGFVLFGTIVYGWVFPAKFGDSLTGLLAVSLVLGLLGVVLIVSGLNWHRTATDAVSVPGPRKL